MTQLVTQPSYWPTRKMTAVIVTGMVMGGARAFVSAVWPDNPLGAYIDGMEGSVQAAVEYTLTVVPMIVAGWFVRDEKRD